MADSDEDWGKRRANMRHEVQLPAVAEDPICGTFRCTIEDVSSTGMALVMEAVAPQPGQEPLKQGRRVGLTFAPDPENAPLSKISVPCTVMWRTPVAFGVRFVEINEALRAGLKAIASHAVEDRVASTKRTGLSPEQRGIMLECRKTVQRLLPNLIWTLRTEITRLLRAKAEELDNDALAAPLLADAKLIDEKSSAIGRTIEHQFLQGFAVASDLDETQELTMGHLAGTLGGVKGNASAGLADNAEVDQNSRITALAHTTEERYKSKYFELDVRLANVIEHPLDRDKNPLAPATACRILWQATVTYCNSVEVQRALQNAIQKRITPLLGEMYEELHKTLDKAGAQRIFDLKR